MALTVSSVSWAVASWWQSRLSTTVSPRVLSVVGTLLIVVGGGGVALSLSTLPTAVAYPAWALAGIGMGLAHTTGWLVATSIAPTGGEGSTVAGMLIGDTLGFGLGTALVGGALAAGQRAGMPVVQMLAFSFFGVALVALGDSAVSLRLPRRLPPAED
jgi:multidrug transporter EmrE-like cation transporter